MENSNEQLTDNTLPCQKHYSASFPCSAFDITSGLAGYCEIQTATTSWIAEIMTGTNINLHFGDAGSECHTSNNGQRTRFRIRLIHPSNWYHYSKSTLLKSHLPYACVKRLSTAFQGKVIIFINSVIFSDSSNANTIFADCSAYSRKREINYNSSFSVNG